jgi:hypothetical protein
VKVLFSINYPIVGVPNFDPYPNDVLVMCGTITTHSIARSLPMLFFFHLRSWMPGMMVDFLVKHTEVLPGEILLHGSASQS